MKGFILYIISRLLTTLLSGFGLLWQLIRNFNGSGKYFLNLAGSFDQLGNVSCAKMFDDLLITEKGYKFGNMDEKISSVLGKNKANNTLTRTGKFIANFLDSVDENHVEKSIDLTESDT